ncbi:MAG: hypothetical protein NTW07_02025 [candidate division Zixibacteria bacterium]|nr:hypothetical protein [candidate division Zixibacteria bacterium]
MRKVVTLALTALLCAIVVGDVHAGHRHEMNLSMRGNHVFEFDDNTWFDLDDGSVVITHKERGEPRSTVEITDSYELYIDDERISLDSEQQALVREFYDQSVEIVDFAKTLGIEGAKIGVDGAKLGAKAVGCLFKLLSPDYDTDDYENEMEHEAKQIESKAKILEEKANEIEDMSDELDDLARDMRSEIPELRELRWF